MTKIFHHLDQEIFTALLRGKNRALLLRNLEESDSELQGTDDCDHWLFHSCLELDLPSINATHPFAIDGYTLFFGNEKHMAEFTHEVSSIIPESEKVWQSTNLIYFLGYFLEYPAGAIQYMLSHPVLNEWGECLVRYGAKRFRIRMEEVIETCEQLWLMFPQEAKIMYLEFVSPETIQQPEPKIYDILAHDRNRLQRVVEDCQQMQRKLKKQKMFQSLWEKWKRP